MQSPVPVLFIIHSLGHGGMERQVTALCRSMDRTRYRPHVATVLEGFRAAELRHEGIPVVVLPHRSFLDPGPLAMVRYLARYIRENGIQLVHMFDPGFSPVSVAAARMRGVCLLSSQRSYMQLIPWKYRYVLMAAHWLSAAVVANSEAVRQHLYQQYRYPLSRIEVCHNGVDITAFTPQGRERLEGLRSADLVIGTVSVLRREKNLEHLVQAFAGIHRTRPGARLLIMGSGPEEGALKARARDTGIYEASCFLPSAADVRGAMRSIDIFVNCSLSESLPNAVMEAMACGCCVVASAVGGSPELIRDGAHGLLCRPGEIADLEARLQQATDDPKLRARIAAAAAQRMRDEFSEELSALTMQAIYDRRLALQRPK